MLRLMPLLRVMATAVRDRGGTVLEIRCLLAELSG
jgi:hypothetical protein